MIKRRHIVRVWQDETIEVETPFSSSLTRMTWKDNTLAVQFVSGQKYIYTNVSLEIVQKLITSFSIGSAFDSIVKKGDYEYSKVTE